MKKLSMILTLLFVMGLSATGHTSDECVLFEKIFERSSRRPVAQFEYFQALDGEAIVKVYNETENRHVKKVRSAAIFINGKKIVRHRDFYKKKFFRFWNFRKKKFFRCSYVSQPDDVIEKTVELTKGRNSMKVRLHSGRGGKLKVVIAKPKRLGSDDSDCDIISDDGSENNILNDNPCTGGRTALCDDNCPNDFNPDQADSDGDGIGDVCDDGDDGYPNIVTATIDVGTGPYGGIETTPDGEFVYVSNYSGGTVSVIKTANMNVTEIPVGGGPCGVSITPGSSFVYVANYASNSVSVIDTSNDSVVNTIQVGNAPFGISMTPNGKIAYVVNYNSGTVSVIDVFKRELIDTIQVGSRPYGVTVASDGDVAYVSNYLSSTVSVIDTSSNNVIDTIQVGGGSPSGISITPDGNVLYVCISGSGQVLAIRISDKQVIATIPVGNSPSGISMTPNGAYAYVSNAGSDTVSVIQTATNTVIDTIQVGSQPYAGTSVSPDGRSVYIGNFGSNTVSVIGF